MSTAVYPRTHGEHFTAEYPRTHGEHALRTVALWI
ncbi:conserved protein of unknown function [Xenorhabdus doucetiae]|uniref:Uncharacterized protein n=1 Tax=Xenorhabdus doucetiae TaxID=351671 RepID=A0A068QVR5_9GAMM|nr:conserved protein of unknown function [Xenorhabdus doucetiae]